jgi:hypothetical protein
VCKDTQEWLGWKVGKKSGANSQKVEGSLPYLGQHPLISIQKFQRGKKKTEQGSVTSSWHRNVLSILSLPNKCIKIDITFFQIFLTL